VYRIRLHGRGGQGMKTAGRILGSAFFAEGFEVQDAPRYGAERRGAPIFAAVRAARAPIRERGAIRCPDLVVVADDTLVGVAAAGVLAGLSPSSVLLLLSAEAPESWRERLRVAGPLLGLPPAPEAGGGWRFLGAACAGAAARLVGAISWSALEGALREEAGGFGEAALRESLAHARAAWDVLEAHAGCVVEGPDAPAPGPAPDWVDVPLDPVAVAAPGVHGAATSVQVRTGLWRTMRPVVDPAVCHRCVWVCSSFCPDGAISPDAEGRPRIDLDHCKGCMVCAAVCPPHAIHGVPEREAAARAAGARS
jgi:pyruvate ferredoxin oxidoreductase gamma subunit